MISSTYSSSSATEGTGSLLPWEAIQVAEVCYVLLAPVIPNSSSLKGGTAGGWSSLHKRRILGLLALNVLGIHRLDALPVIRVQ